VNGDVTQTGSGTYGGDITASGDITLEQATVAGSLSSGEDISLVGGTVGDGSTGSGSVSSIGALKLANGSERTIGENGAATGEVTANGGMITPWSDYNAADFSSNISASGATAPVMASNECNKLDIANAFPSVAANQVNSNMSAGYTGENIVLEFNESTATVFDGSGGTTTISPSTQSSTLWDGNAAVYVFDNLNLHNTMITITGNVTIMVTGNLTTSGGDSGFQFASDDGSNSVTILVEGQVNFGSSSNTFAETSVNVDTQSVPVTIYSSYDSAVNGGKNAILVNGEADLYAKIYAPLGDINYAAGGSLMGSLEGRNVALSGSGDIHYDEALGLIDDYSASNNQGVSFSSVYYYYPD
jgi:hypothetical protein